MHVAIISTRISGNDGVSLEVEHWSEIFTSHGHKVTLIAGKLDRAGICIPELNFQHAKVVKIHDQVIYKKVNYEKIERLIFEQAGIIEGKLREALNHGNKFDLLIVSNVLSLPVHFSFAVALARIIEEKKIPTIARHHDFWWERQRFLKSSMFPFFERWFPPSLEYIKHVTINSISQAELKKRRKLDSAIISDSFDFKSKLNKLDNYSLKFRKDFGIRSDDIVFLQATRIVPRKRIELAIKLVKKLNNAKIILVVAGTDGDESGKYKEKIEKLAKKSGIRCIFIGNRVNSHRKKIWGKRIYTLWDCFLNCDFVTYSSKLEGFGNQLVESIYFKKPVIMTPYPVFTSDIEPKGFEVIKMTPKVDKSTLNQINELILNKEKKEEMVEKNFELGKKCLSYEWAWKQIEKLI